MSRTEVPHCKCKVLKIYTKCKVNEEGSHIVSVKLWIFFKNKWVYWA